ncbi:iron-siderophore ABC transporter substrate-binding protein [Streptomyces sp. NPDC048290]|uniref:iron-siderophore ABC transporter substrate-binding protein n=1 Tax=Streptomyces sp. NPDC048290 TaxID=3155811 RepID=UPI0034230903
MRTFRSGTVKTVLAALAVGGLLAGCSSSGDGSGGGAGDAASGSGDGDRNLVAGASEGPSAAPSALADGMGADTDTDGAFPRTVTHFQGATEIPAAPTRIAALSTGQLDDLLTLGLVPTATTRADNAGLVPDYLTDAFPQYKERLDGMTDAGTRSAPNLETLAAAKPDLILANDSLGELYPQLSKIAPTVVTAGNGINWKRDLLLVGEAVGKGQAAQELLDGIVADAAERGAAIEGDPTVSMVRFTPDRTRMFGVSSFTGSIAVDMGLARPESQRFQAISEDIGAESIDIADGDWIFYSVQGDAAETDAASVVAGPLWKSMGAVRSGQAVRVDDDPWYLNAGPTAARLVIGQLTEQLGA